MAKKKRRNSFDLKHLKNLNKSVKEVSDLYTEAQNELIKIGLLSSHLSKGEEGYSFKDYPELDKLVNARLKTLRSDIVTVIENGELAAWELSNAKNDAMVKSLAAMTHIDISNFAGCMGRNLDALAAFQSRKINGMGLSSNVWNMCKTFKKEMELALSVGMKDGASAAEMSKDVRHLLKYPDKLFRRVKDKETGKLKLSKAAKAFHPGRGVYRSSYKNALRLTATESNMAYRTADHERWQQMSFVTGIEIETSNRHKKELVTDICDDLAGIYPKNFKFVGWHPFCRCFATPKLASVDDFEAYLRDKNADEYTPKEGEVVKEVPKKFNDWLEANAGRIESAKSLPYFLRDNEWAWGKANGKSSWAERPEKKNDLFNVARKRHEARTKEDKERIFGGYVSRYADIAAQVEAKSGYNAPIAKIGELLKEAQGKYSVADYKTAINSAAALLKKQETDAVLKYGKRMLSIFKGVKGVTAANLTKALKSANISEVISEGKKLKETGKKYTALANINNPLKWAKKFTYDELNDCNLAIEKKVASWSGLSAEERAKKLTFEYDWVKKHPKYATSSVALDSYKQMAEPYLKERFKVISKEIQKLKKEWKLYENEPSVKTAISALENAKKEGWKSVKKDIEEALENVRSAVAAAKSAKSIQPLILSGELATQVERDAAIWDKTGGYVIDNILRPGAGKNWRNAPNSMRKDVNGYTNHYNDVNCPLNGIKYFNYQTMGQFKSKTNNLTEYVAREKAPVDFWGQRGDANGFAVLKSRIEAAGGKMPTNLQELVGMKMQNDGFLSVACHKGGGFSDKDLITNIHIRKGSQVAYLEPISDYGKGDGLYWDGISKQTLIGYEQEALLQRGTQFIITKVEQKDGKIFIDCEVIGVELKDINKIPEYLIHG